MSYENIIVSVKEKIYRMNAWWINFNIKHKKARWILFILSAFITLNLFLSYWIPMEVYPDISLLILSGVCTFGLFYATKFFWKEHSGYVMMGSILLLMFISQLFIIIVLIVFGYLLYLFLEERRVAKIMKYAKMSPYELAKLTQEEMGPEIEITVRAGGEK